MDAIGTSTLFYMGCIMNKPILFCSTKAVPHLALIAHLYDLKFDLDRNNKPNIQDGRDWISATFFTDHINITQPIKGYIKKEESSAYKQFIIDNAKNPFNQINYSELLNDDDFDELRQHFEIIQLMIEPIYRRDLILNRVFRLYDKKHKDYSFVDQGLLPHADVGRIELRLLTFMTATGWQDKQDTRGFVKFLFSDESPIFESFSHETRTKEKRDSHKVSYGGLFTGHSDYKFLCELIERPARLDDWIRVSRSLKLPRYHYRFGLYWDTDEIDR